MRDESFDIPYGPISAAFRALVVPVMIATLVTLVGFGAWWFWPQRVDEFPISVSDVSRQKEGAGSVYLERGAAGPYKQGPGVVGVVDGGIALRLKDQSVECPGVKGTHYEAFSYINKDEKSYILVMQYRTDIGVAAVSSQK